MLQKNDADSKTFLNTGIYAWGDDVIFLPDFYNQWYLNRKGTGRKVNPQTRKKRIQEAITYLNLNKSIVSGIKPHSSFYYRDLPTLLCYLSYIAYYLIFSHRRVEYIKLKIKDRRLKAILKVQELYR